MNPTRAAYCLRRFARLCPENRRELHRIARMGPGMRDYAAEPLRMAVADLWTAVERVGDMWRHPDLVGPRDALFWLESTATWLVAAVILAMVDTESIADEPQNAQNGAEETT